MYKLMQQIEEDAKKKKISKTLIAKELRVSNAAVSAYFNPRPNRPIINFFQYTRLLKIIYGCYREDLLIEYWKRVSRKVSREALEWAYVNGKLDLLRFLVDKELLKEYSDPFAKVYLLMLMRSKKEISAAQFLYEVEKMRGTLSEEKGVIEAQVLLDICLLYALCDSACYALILEYNSFLKEKIPKIKNDYLRKAFSARAQKITAHSCLKRNKINECERIATEMISEEYRDKFPLYYNSALLFLSEVYVFSDYQKSISYIKRALGMLDELKGFSKREFELKSTHDFIQIVNGNYNELYLNSLAEKAHYLARQGSEQKRQEALEILEELRRKNGNLSAFQLYYKALATRDAHDMRIAQEAFYQCGDQYYVRLTQNKSYF
ncbi:hypothetical protein GFC29_3841 (plasmid) [Anoxybacillus sp. B7M1]|uniref:AimR family lysis-lysogeny pheromone receptor n=1 Tax=Anoxybacillus sp. B7M1 TaxID=1490057 RepID=UPI0005CCB693|nr:AimR family lysis-lysogeny pheromone receptor [Anoxybacillus sp. B7M1]ANB66129.1 hypothetical protein GFC29_3841 [Anoxybacillus sp. B7M1]